LAWQWVDPDDRLTLKCIPGVELLIMSQCKFRLSLPRSARRYTPGIVCGLLLVGGPAHAFTLDLFESGDSVSSLVSALLHPSSGITVTGATFVGREGDGSDPNTAQSATYTGFSLTPNNPGLPLISNPDGIFLTSGVANIPTTNTADAFDHGFVGVTAPGTGTDADLDNMITGAGGTQLTSGDTNFLEIEFTVAADRTSVEANFVFGSDEFPDQDVTDAFGFFVDGTNFAFFPDGSLVSFVTGVNADNFNDNDVGTGNYDIEYDGISDSLRVVGILDPNLLTHTLKIAIADTSDELFDSGVFIGGLKAGTDTNGGINGHAPTPATVALLGVGLLGLRYARRRTMLKG
jgi:hypothetical protein